MDTGHNRVIPVIRFVIYGETGMGYHMLLGISGFMYEQVFLPYVETPDGIARRKAQKKN